MHHIQNNINTTKNTRNNFLIDIWLWLRLQLLIPFLAPWFLKKSFSYTNKWSKRRVELARLIGILICSFWNLFSSLNYSQPALNFIGCVVLVEFPLSTRIVLSTFFHRYFLLIRTNSQTVFATSMLNEIVLKKKKKRFIKKMTLTKHVNKKYFIYFMVVFPILISFRTVTRI